MNTIPDIQNGDPALRLLRARQRTYQLATQLQVLQFAAAVVAPTVLALIAIAQADARAVFAAISLFLLLFDIFILDRAQAFFLRRAARIAEQFDCDVLQLPWNAFIADKKLDHEDIAAAADAYPRNAKAQSVLRDWYPSAVKRAPLHIARIICQLANLRYDAKLRRRYAMFLCVFPVLVAIAAVVAWSSLGLTFQDVVLSVFAPATPATIWALREVLRHSDAAAAQERIKNAVDAVWAGVKTLDVAAATLKAREFQDAIFLRRVSSPLIFPIVYHLLRDKMEDQMNKGADERLAEAGF